MSCFGNMISFFDYIVLVSVHHSSLFIRPRREVKGGVEKRRIRMEELREEVCVKESFSWRGAGESGLDMWNERLTKRADAPRLEHRRRRGRPRLKKEDCVNRDLVGVGSGEREIWGVEAGGGDGNEVEPVTGKQNKTIENQYRCQPHLGLQ